jgi:hypothetical protein
MSRSRSPHGNWMTSDWWLGISGLAGIVGAVAAILQLLLERGSVLLTALAGAFVLLAVGALTFASRRGIRERVIVIDDYRRDAPSYYEQYCEMLRQARHVIYLAGGGFHGRDALSREYGEMVNQATRRALDAGARLYRVQTSDHTGRHWSNGLAAMIEDYPGRVRVYKDLGRPVFADIGVYDPDEKDCAVHIAIKAEHTYGLGRDARVVGALLIFGNRELARGLQGLFARRMKVLGEPMTAAEVRALAAEHDDTSAV